MDNDAYDLAVIGGGIVGCMAVRQYRRTWPERRVALFERGAVGAGCSGFAGAMAAPAVRTPAMRPWSDFSRDWYSSYLDEYPGAPLSPMPILYVATSSDAPDLAQRTAAQPRQVLPDGTHPAVPPWLVLHGDEQLYDCGIAMRAEVASLCRHLLRGAGADLFECSPVLSPRRAGGQWLLPLPDGRVFRAAKLVVAKGAWLAADRQWRGLGARTKKVVAYLLDAPVAPGAAIIYFPTRESFLLPLAERGQWLLSVTSSAWDCQPDGEGLTVGPEELTLARALLERHAPALAARLRGARVGCDTYSADRHPAIAVLDGAVFAYGASGSGFRYAPALARAALRALESDT